MRLDPDAIAREAARDRQGAIDAVRALARELGLGECAPAVIAERSNLVLSLSPHPLVARVAMATSRVRVGMAWLRREVEISRWLAARGCAVTRPAGGAAAGPFERAGLVISMWEREEEIAAADAPLHARAAGERLASAHLALRAYPAGELPEWGAWTEAREVLPRALACAHLAAAERARVERAWERGEAIVRSARARSASFQAVHGDAHRRNVLSSRGRGPLWTDWEDAFVGPIEHDLACLRSRLELFGQEREEIEAITAAHHDVIEPALGRAIDRGFVRELALVRNLQVIPWLAVFAERDPTLVASMRARIERLP